MSKTAVILAGHGSHISPHTAGLVWSQVDQLRALNVVDEVTAAFWKEMPSFHTVFDSLNASDITVVPLFTAQGYFTQTVIPAEMGLTDAVTLRDGKTIRYARTLSEYPYLEQVVRQRVEDAIRQRMQLSKEAISASQIAVAIIGHSTRRNSESRKATEAQVEAIRRLQLVAEVYAVYLDDDPSIPQIYEMSAAPCIIAVPYFLAYGSHTLIDVPRALGFDDAGIDETAMQSRHSRINGRDVIYTPPVGIGDDLQGVILELLREAGTPLKPVSAGTLWDSFPQRAFSALSSFTIPFRFGQLWITETEIRHVDEDQNAPPCLSLDELRARVRESPFRSLATSADVPKGWCISAMRDYERTCVIETVYPGVLGTAQAVQESSHAANPLPTVIARQTGQYQRLAALDETQVNRVIENVCSGCVLYPAWAGRDVSHDSELPCREACNHWLSAAVEELEREIASHGR
ncbi:MAG: CbiX/SirB N-terminal domain-containing protein [bacterium]|nr:CbiX/SirB N-terminal domain-containing protein [bacterium]